MAPTRAAASSESRQLLEPTEFFQVGKEGPGIRVYLRYDLFRALDEYAMRDTSREQAGLLVGQIHDAGEGSFLIVEDAIECGIGDDTTGRFSARTWQHARRVARARHQDKLIVGWFHTHPGTGLELSQEELEVHGNFFPEPWQLVYVVDPVSKDRNFYHPGEKGRLTACSGFRIYGKDAAGSSGSHEKAAPSTAPPRPGDEHMRERYIERSLEKIQRLVRRPSVRPVDVLIVLLLTLNLLWMALRPASSVSVDTRGLDQGQKEMSKQLTAVRERLEKLEQHLAALQMLDEELALAPTPTAPAAAETPTQSPTEAASPQAGATPDQATPAGEPSAAESPGSLSEGRAVRLHKVKEGDTLSTITETYYKTSSPAAVTALARFNKLKPPNFDIFPGDTVKIPSRESLKF